MAYFIRTFLTGASGAGGGAALVDTVASKANPYILAYPFDDGFGSNIQTHQHFAGAAVVLIVMDLRL